jgi:formylglycine-generating enzyme required for sulfatase activity
MVKPAFWILPMALVTLLDGPAGPLGATQSRPKEVRNSIGMRLVEIPGGSLDMGSTVGPGEAPAHRVSVRSFWMGGTTHPVGLKQPNAFGLYDIFGNVPEWTGDTWHADYKGAPTDGSTWEGGGSRPYHTLRGGGWELPAFFLHAALRGPYGEIHRRGFRVAADYR